MTLSWYLFNDVWKGQDTRGITVAEVSYAQQGDVEGGLGALMRCMAGANGVPQPPLSPAGWYWQGTVKNRGVWCRPQGPFASAQEAQDAADKVFLHDVRWYDDE